MSGGDWEADFTVKYVETAGRRDGDSLFGMGRYWEMGGPVLGG